jgi:hypothetical protein
MMIMMMMMMTTIIKERRLRIICRGCVMNVGGMDWIRKMWRSIGIIP